MLVFFTRFLLLLLYLLLHRLHGQSNPNGSLVGGRGIDCFPLLFDLDQTFLGTALGDVSHQRHVGTPITAVAKNLSRHFRGSAGLGDASLLHHFQQGGTKLHATIGKVLWWIALGLLLFGFGRFSFRWHSKYSSKQL